MNWVVSTPPSPMSLEHSARDASTLFGVYDVGFRIRVSGLEIFGTSNESL